MRESWRIILLMAVGAAVCIGFALAWRGGVKEGRKVQLAEDALRFRPDTTVVRDTAWFPKPVPYSVVVTDTSYIPLTDTVRLRDTVFMVVPIERKVYEDSLYRAVVSGYRPSLDEIEVFRSNVLVTVTESVPEPQRLNSVFLEYGASYGSTYAGLVVLGYRRDFRSGFYVRAGGGVDIASKTSVLQGGVGYAFRW